MPLSEIDAGALTPAEFDERGAPDVVVRCWSCGYLVRTHEPDVCPCGAVSATRVDGLMKIQSAQNPPPEVWRLSSDAHAV